jgi:hypothetical protein
MTYKETNSVDDVKQVIMPTMQYGSCRTSKTYHEFDHARLVRGTRGKVMEDLNTADCDHLRSKCFVARSRRPD